MPEHRPHVVIVGGGFAGLSTARSMTDLPVDVTVVDRQNHHGYLTWDRANRVIVAGTERRPRAARRP